MMRYGLLPALCGIAMAQAPLFERDVLPIFTANCFSCHGGTAMVGLDLRTRASVLHGSHQGKIVKPGSAAESPLYEKVKSEAMPPPAFNFKLTDAQIETIRQWIEAGAKGEEKQAAVSREHTERFDKEAKPVLAARCVQCHGAGKPAAGLDLRTLAGVLDGSANGPVILEGASDKSPLVRKIMSRSMPPPGTSQPVTEPELHVLRQWIDTSKFNVRLERPAELREAFTDAEAPRLKDSDRQAWAFRKPAAAAAAPPEVKNKARVRTPIDRFLLARLESKGLGFSPDAPPLTLLRRAYLDLHGLPPTRQEIDAFLADTKPGAWERLIDKLLESPHYGERWARHWLDAAGYVDVAGFDNDLVGMEMFDGIWRYRDWVVNAFNSGKPYDRFLVEQLAGDELTDWRKAASYSPETLDLLTATGYLRSVFDRTDPDIVNLPGERFDVLFHLMEKVSTNLMGLTVGCARCHSHRYDPIPQRDYYRMLAVFTPSYNPWNWKQPKNRHLADVSKEEEKRIAEHNKDIDVQAGRLHEELARLRKPAEEKLLDANLAKLPENIRTETREALATAEDKRDDVQKFLVRKFEKQVRPPVDSVDKSLNEADRAAVARLTEQAKTLRGYRRTVEKIQALWDVGPPPVTRLLQRGMVESPGPKVAAGGLEVLGGGDFAKPAEARGETTGHRLAFARWLTSPEHPLTARVMVNRVWQHHFGVGIVATPENFGKAGEAPTHPELLDWLAADFMANGWQLKRLHRTIMLSTAYRQSSRSSGSSAADPENKLLARMNLRRLEAEALRDAILTASGKLDRAIGGPAIALKPQPDGGQVLDPSAKSGSANRRSLYIAARRNYPHQLLQVFDFPTVQVNCTRRVNSATPLQSLTMMNDEFVVEQAEVLAGRLAETAAADTDGRIELAWRLTLGRPPEPEEVRAAKGHLEKQKQAYLFANAKPADAEISALTSLCQMLFAANEFLYIE
ncbi:MAG: DUF1553 domain-containing protein [Acidobacteria bacterium]|nr:DUF1553 domain-containing protein [Acidobacteriota bacterium]